MGNISQQKRITLIRGDSLSMPVKINLGTEVNPNIYHLSTTDKLYIGVMEANQAFENAIIRKVYDCNSLTDNEGNILFELSPCDTENLRTGTYYWQAKLLLPDPVTNTERVLSVISPSHFWLIGSDKTAEIVENQPVTKHTIYDGGEII